MSLLCGRVIRGLGDHPNFPGLVGAHVEPACFVESEPCWSETILVPDIWHNLPTFTEVWVAHNVDNSSLASLRSHWLAVREVDLGNLVTHRTITIPRVRLRQRI